MHLPYKVYPFDTIHHLRLLVVAVDTVVPDSDRLSIETIFFDAKPSHRAVLFPMGQGCRERIEENKRTIINRNSLVQQNISSGYYMFI